MQTAYNLDKTTDAYKKAVEIFNWQEVQVANAYTEEQIRELQNAGGDYAAFTAKGRILVPETVGRGKTKEVARDEHGAVRYKLQSGSVDVNIAIDEQMRQVLREFAAEHVLYGLVQPMLKTMSAQGTSLTSQLAVTPELVAAFYRTTSHEALKQMLLSHRATNVGTVSAIMRACNGDNPEMLMAIAEGAESLLTRLSHKLSKAKLSKAALAAQNTIIQQIRAIYALRSKPVTMKLTVEKAHGLITTMTTVADNYVRGLDRANAKLNQALAEGNSTLVDETKAQIELMEQYVNGAQDILCVLDNVHTALQAKEKERVRKQELAAKATAKAIASADASDEDSAAEAEADTDSLAEFMD